MGVFWMLPPCGLCGGARSAHPRALRVTRRRCHIGTLLAMDFNMLTRCPGRQSAREWWLPASGGSQGPHTASQPDRRNNSIPSFVEHTSWRPLLEKCFMRGEVHQPTKGKRSRRPENTTRLEVLFRSLSFPGGARVRLTFVVTDTTMAFSSNNSTTAIRCSAILSSRYVYYYGCQLSARLLLSLPTWTIIPELCFLHTELCHSAPPSPCFWPRASG